MCHRSRHKVFELSSLFRTQKQKYESMPTEIMANKIADSRLNYILFGLKWVYTKLLTTFVRDVYRFRSFLNQREKKSCFFFFHKT